MVGTLNISFLSAALIVAVVALLAVVVWRERRAATLSRAADQLDGIVRDGRYAERVRGGGKPAQVLALSANKLLEQIAMKDLLISERERSLVGLLGGLARSGCRASRRHRVRQPAFRRAYWSGQSQHLIGKSMADLVHPDYRELVRRSPAPFARWRAGLDRLEVELLAQRDQHDPRRVVRGAHRLSGRPGAAADAAGNGTADGKRVGCSCRLALPRGKRSTRWAKASSPLMSAVASTISIRRPSS